MLIKVSYTFCKISVDETNSFINTSKDFIYSGTVSSSVETLDTNCGITNKAKAIISPITVINVVKIDKGLFKPLTKLDFSLSKK